MFTYCYHPNVFVDALSSSDPIFTSEVLDELVQHLKHAQHHFDTVFAPQVRETLELYQLDTDDRAEDVVNDSEKDAM